MQDLDQAKMKAFTKAVCKDGQDATKVRPANLQAKGWEHTSCVVCDMLLFQIHVYTCIVFFLRLCCLRKISRQNVYKTRFILALSSLIIFVPPPIYEPEVHVSGF